MRDPGPFWPLDPGWITFPRDRNRFFRLKYLKFFDADPGSGMKKFGSGMEKIRIRDPGKASRNRNTVYRL